jgi:hypothetical protein
MKTTDGTGAELVDDALYFVQDARGCVGNCGSWWAPFGSGYVCNIDEAGQYTGKDVCSLRDTDVPWPVDYVLARTVRHVRVDNQAFSRNDRPVVETPRRCASCGHPENNHRYRHRFVPWMPGMPEPKARKSR